MNGWHRLIATVGICFTLTACNDTLSSVANKVEHPLPTKIVNRMQAYDMTKYSPIMMRIFKEESVLEIWKQQRTGRYEKIAQYEICKWSGDLGPKKQEGDYQAPEGFYTVNRHQMNPNSSYYLSFNLGYPNRFDRAHGRTGSNLMVHGACSSAGCYSMTDESVLEIYAFAREAFRGGQEAFQVQAFPFRMTAENMAEHRGNENFEFWKMLKVGYDHFELTKMPPKVDVCERRYVFNRVALEEDGRFVADEMCPPSEVPQALATAYRSYAAEYQHDFAEAVREEQGGGSSPLAAFLPGGSDGGTKMSTPMMASMPVTPATQPATVQPAVAPMAAAVAAPARVAPSTAGTAIQAPAATTPTAGTPAARAPTAATAAMTGESAAVPQPRPLPAPQTIPVPQAEPERYDALENASLYAAPATQTVQASAAGAGDKPFWNIWSRN